MPEEELLYPASPPTYSVPETVPDPITKQFVIALRLYPTSALTEESPETLTPEMPRFLIIDVLIIVPVSPKSPIEGLDDLLIVRLLITCPLPSNIPLK